MRSQSGYVAMDVTATATAIEIETENGVGVAKRNANLSGGLVIDLPPLNASLESANETRSATTIVNGNALGNEREIGTGLLDVAVGTAVRAVRGAGAVVADTIATGHWPRGWDSNIFSRMRPSITDLHDELTWTSQHSVSGTDPFYSHDAHYCSPS
jgi:hypothetical protein